MGIWPIIETTYNDLIEERIISDKQITDKDIVEDFSEKGHAFWYISGIFESLVEDDEYYEFLCKSIIHLLSRIDVEESEIHICCFPYNSREIELMKLLKFVPISRTQDNALKLSVYYRESLSDLRNTVKKLTVAKASVDLEANL